MEEVRAVDGPRLWGMKNFAAAAEAEAEEGWWWTSPLGALPEKVADAVESLGTGHGDLAATGSSCLKVV